MQEDVPNIFSARTSLIEELNLKYLDECVPKDAHFLIPRMVNMFSHGRRESAEVIKAEGGDYPI